LARIGLLQNNMKTYEDLRAEFNTEREYERADVKEILDSFERYHRTLGQFIEQFERVFLLSGEACGYNTADLCKTCQEKK